VPYDVCGDNRNFYKAASFERIGYGVIHEIDDVRWNNPPKYTHVWRIKNGWIDDGATKCNTPPARGNKDMVARARARGQATESL